MINGYKADWIIIDDIIYPDGNIETIYSKLDYEMICSYDSICVSTIDCCNVAAPVPQAKSKLGWKNPTKAPVCVKQEQEGNTPMTTNTERDYLNNRIRTINCTLRNGLEKQFNLYVNGNPKSYKDLIDWIKNDKFTLDAKLTKRIDAFADDGTYFGSFTDGIKWTGAPQPDFDGYTLAVNALDAAKTAAQDVINTTTDFAGEGRKALTDFEAFTFTPTPAA